MGSYFDLLEECFPGIKTNIQRCKNLGFHWSSRPFLKEKDGEILSHVGCLEYPILIDGAIHQAGALHAICTKATHRNQGLASSLIQEALHWAKKHYEFVILFTEIPEFYEKLSFNTVQEYRFLLPYKHDKGSQKLRPLISPNDNDLFLNCFRTRVPVSNQFWVKDHGFIAAFNTLFASYPTFWSLYYSPTIDGLISYRLEDKTLHLFDIVAKEIPSLDLILDHMPSDIEQIYFYFPPDGLTSAAIQESFLYDHGYLQVFGKFPTSKPFMISPLSRC